MFSLIKKLFKKEQSLVEEKDPMKKFLTFETQKLRKRLWIRN